MKDLSNPFWIKLKGLLFLFIGIAAAILIFLDSPTLRTAVLLLIAIPLLSANATSAVPHHPLARIFGQPPDMI